MFFQIGDYRITTIVTDELWCENCYLVEHFPSTELVIIDPGDSADRIIRTVSSIGKGLKKLLITHAHHDHVGAADALHKRFEVPCYMHKADMRLIRQAHTYALVFDKRQMKPLAAPCLYVDEEVMEIGRQPIRVIYTPGHTSGSVCYDFGDFIFTGDTILYQHVGRTDTPGASKDQLISSVNRLMEQLTDRTVIFPGHGRSWTVGEARTWWQDVVMPPEYKRFGGI